MTILALSAEEKKQRRLQQKREAMARYRAAHPDRARESLKKSYDKHAGERREVAKKYYREHAQERLAYNNSWVARNPTKRVANYERFRYREENRINVLIKDAARRAQRKGLEFDGLACLQGLTPESCPYCKITFDYTRRGMKLRGPGPSIDRIDNTKGYVEGNVQIICFRCNALKNNTPVRCLPNVIAKIRKDAIRKRTA